MVWESNDQGFYVPTGIYCDFMWDFIISMFTAKDGERNSNQPKYTYKSYMNPTVGLVQPT